MNNFPEGNAVIYCQGAFNTTNGKTAHGLVRFTRRYHVLSVIDSRYSEKDAGEVLDGQPKNVPIVASIEEALRLAVSSGQNPTHMVIGLAPDGGRLSLEAREDVKKAIESGLHIDIGLHDFLTEDSEMMALAEAHGVTIRDIRKPLPRSQLHFFSGKIEEVSCLKIAVLGTDSAVGKRTTAWLIIKALEGLGITAEMVGTGQTSWLQGAKYGTVFDSLVNDFVSGEIEHAVWSAWKNEAPDVIIIEGQGSLMNPAYPGGYEILAAARPDIIVLQHAPARKEYDGFPGYPIHPLSKQISAIEYISSKPVVAVTINHEDLEAEEIPHICTAIQNITGLPAYDVLTGRGAANLAEKVLTFLKKQ